MVAVEYSPFPRKLRNVNRKIRAVSLYTRGEGYVCMSGKREAACLKKMRIRARGRKGRRKKRESTIPRSYTHTHYILRESF